MTIKSGSLGYPPVFTRGFNTYVERSASGKCSFAHLCNLSARLDKNRTCKNMIEYDIAIYMLYHAVVMFMVVKVLYT